MRTEQEIVDSRIVMRSLCGALALMGAAAMVYRLHPVAVGRTPFDYWLLVSMIGALHAVCLFGHVALRGRLPSFMARAGDPAGN